MSLFLGNGSILSENFYIKKPSGIYGGGLPGDCNFLIDANGDFVLDANGNFICMQDTEVIQRYFTRLMSSVSSHYTVPTVTGIGDYSITTLVYFTGSDLPLLGNTSTSNSSIRISSTGRVVWRPEDATATELRTGAGTVPLNELSLVTIDRTIATGTISINSVLSVQGVVPQGSAQINTIGRINADYANNIVADILITGDITQDGNPNAAADGILYRLDEDFATTTVARNANAVDGPDITPALTGWDVTSGANISNNTFTTTFGARGVFFDLTSLVVGNSYVYKADIGNSDPSILEMIIYNTPSFSGQVGVVQVAPNSLGEIGFIATNTSQRVYLRRASVGTTEVNTLSVVESAGTATAVNIGTDDSELFTFDGSVSPNTWTSESGTVLPVAGT
jgi:hypothetical protein